MSNIESLRGEEDDGVPDEWEQVTQLAKQFNAEQAEKAPERATEFFKAARSVERDFDRRRQTIESNGGKMSREEFEKWEDALSDEIKYAESELRKTDYRLETVAGCKKAMIFSANDAELHKTIEAQAGRFYHERISDLREAIQSSGNEQMQEELDYAKGFYNAVMAHLDYKYIPPDEIGDFGYSRYDQGRTLTHNNAIKHLNGINDLAKKYHVRPLTVRNFWPGIIRETKPLDIKMMMRYDRDLVEEYYAIAFSSEIQRREHTRARQARYGLY